MSFIINAMNNFIDQLSSADQKLYDGIYHTNYELIKEAVEEGADLNKVVKTSLFSENTYPLRELIIHDSSEHIVKLLLELGANPNYTDKSGFTLLMRSCGAKSWGVNHKNIEHYFDLLLDYGANVNETNSSGFTALDFAVQQNQGEHKINRLLQKGAKVSVNTLKAIKERIYDCGADYKTLRYAFNLCKDLNEKSILDPEITSALNGDFAKVVEIFKSHNLSSKNKRLILNLAACFADRDSFKFLEENIKLSDNDDIKDFITLASEYGNVAVIKYFLDEKGIDVNTPLSYSFGNAETMLTFAIKNDEKDLANYLISKNGTTEKYYVNKITENGDTKLLNILLENNMLCTKKDIFSLLNSAVFCQNIDMLKYIADNPRINKICSKKELLTRMVYEICTWHPENKEMLSYCISNGGEISKEALKKAFDKSLSLESVKLLIDYGADISILANANIIDSCIFQSIHRGNFEKVKFLVENGLKVDDQIIKWAENSLSSRILEYLKAHRS